MLYTVFKNGGGIKKPADSGRTTQQGTHSLLTECHGCQYARCTGPFTEHKGTWMCTNNILNTKMHISIKLVGEHNEIIIRMGFGKGYRCFFTERLL